MGAECGAGSTDYSGAGGRQAGAEITEIGLSGERIFRHLHALVSTVKCKVLSQSICRQIQTRFMQCQFNNQNICAD